MFVVFLLNYPFCLLHVMFALRLATYASYYPSLAIYLPTCLSTYLRTYVPTHPTSPTSPTNPTDPAIPRKCLSLMSSGNKREGRKRKKENGFGKLLFFSHSVPPNSNSTLATDFYLFCFIFSLSPSTHTHSRTLSFEQTWPTASFFLTLFFLFVNQPPWLRFSGIKRVPFALSTFLLLSSFPLFSSSSLTLHTSTPPSTSTFATPPSTFHHFPKKIKHTHSHSPPHGSKKEKKKVTVTLSLIAGILYKSQAQVKFKQAQARNQAGKPSKQTKQTAKQDTPGAYLARPLSLFLSLLQDTLRRSLPSLRICEPDLPASIRKQASKSPTDSHRKI